MKKSQPVMVSDTELLTLRPKIVWAAYKMEGFGFLCICAYLFLEYVKPEQQYSIFGILPFLKMSVLGALVYLTKDKSVKWSFTFLHFLVSFFLVQCLLSSIFAYRSDISFQFFDIIFFFILVFFLISAYVNSERRLFLFMLVYYLVNFRMSEYGFLTWVRRGFSFATHGVTGTGWYRNSGELGMQMSMFFAYSACFAAFFRDRWKGWVKWLMYFMPLSAVGTVLASSSRGAIVALLAILLYMSLFSKQKFKVWIGCIVLVSVAYLALPPEFKARFETAGEDHTSVTRFEYWEHAKAMMGEHPGLGVGYFNWVVYYEDFYFDPSKNSRVELAHNTFLQAGAELGAVGLAIFIGMIAVSFVFNWKSERLARGEGFEFLRCFAIGMNAAAVGLILGSIFLTATFLPSYWIHFAFTVCLKQIIDKRHKESGGIRRGSRS